MSIQNSLEANLGICGVCSVSCTTNCGACMKVSYCSKAHQQKHWKIHKFNCFPLVLKSSEVFGRYLVATRDIKKGEIVLREKPIFSGPHFSTAFDDQEERPICLSCFRIVQSQYECSSCKWPVCSEFCEKESGHSDLECKIFTNRKITPTKFFASGNNYSIYEAITILRGVLQKELDPIKWSKILDLQSHPEERLQTENGRELKSSSVHFVRKFCGQEQFTEWEINHVLGAVGVNAFVSDDGVSEAKLFRNGTYLYHIASMPAHNCVPNSYWVIQLNSDFHLRASIPIKCGESVTFLYTEATLTTMDRQLKLMESKYFSCTCNRCSDPSELGSYFSAVKCQDRKCSGYLLPMQPLSFTNISTEDWKCNNCQAQKSYALIFSVISAVDSELETVGQENSLKNLEKLLKIVERHSGFNLHPAHSKIHDVENDLLQRISFLLLQQKQKSSPNKSFDKNGKWTDKLVELSRKCLKTADTIWPGYNRHRGRILYFLQQGLTTQLLNFYDGKNLNKDAKNVSKLEDDINEILLIREEVLEIFKIEPEGREESYIAKAMAVNSPEIQFLKGLVKK